MALGIAVLAMAALGVWLLASEPGGPQGLDTASEPSGQGDGPVLATRGLAEEPEAEEPPATPPLEADVFLARIDGKTGGELQKALFEDLGRPLEETRAVVAALLRILQEEEHTSGACGLARMRLAAMSPAILEQLRPYLDPADAKLARDILYVFENWLRMGRPFELPDLMPLLDSEDRWLKHGALATLSWGVPYEQRLHDRLLAMTREADRMACVALMRMGDPAFDSFLALFDGANTAKRNVLFLILRKAPRERIRRTLPIIRKGILDPDPAVASAALLALRVLGAEGVVALPELRTVLCGEAESSTRAALGALQILGPAGAPALPEVLPLCDHPHDGIADDAARLVGVIGGGDEDARRALVRLIRKDASDTAARSLASFGTEGLREALALIAGPDADARYAALWTLATQGEAAASAVHALIPLIEQQEDTMLRLRAIGTAGFIGPKAAAVVPSIMRAFLSEAMPLEAGEAAGSLARLGPQARRAIRDGLRSKQAVLRLRCAEVLVHFHGSSHFALDELLPLLDEPAAEMRRAAFRAIRACIVHPFKQGADYPALRDKALHARLGPIFDRMAKDPDDGVRELATQAQAALADVDGLATMAAETR